MRMLCQVGSINPKPYTRLFADLHFYYVWMVEQAVGEGFPVGVVVNLRAPFEELDGHWS